MLYDILGIGKKLSFAKDFLSESNSIEECIKNYIQSVKKERFRKTKFSLQYQEPLKKQRLILNTPANS